MAFAHQGLLSDQVGFYLLPDLLASVLLEDGLEVDDLQSVHFGSAGMLHFVDLSKRALVDKVKYFVVAHEEGLLFALPVLK